MRPYKIGECTIDLDEIQAVYTEDQPHNPIAYSMGWKFPKTKTTIVLKGKHSLVLTDVDGESLEKAWLGGEG